MARILLAEDDEAVRRFVARALAHRGHEVREAGDGFAALDALDEKTPFDLLITDIVMPGMDGIELALRVARDMPELPVLLMTGYSAERQRAHNLDELICSVITKPFTLSAICEAAENSLGGGAAGAGGSTRG
ncbi:response regulator [Ferruginivarius sediminum]|uniref:Response regulator n=1 Tax=Ferruginivarius sediminum TaxID=2661937 RepID=A0A369T9C3_9PROT|nr:response regulator [Ferruginivarius sediminum]RDD61913.1 response regulator [Ferruginivarius sediminum]